MWQCGATRTMNSPERRNWTREGTEKLPASDGWEARLDGTVNKRELLINFVTINKPKMLIGLSQRACGKDVVFVFRNT